MNPIKCIKVLSLASENNQSDSLNTMISFLSDEVEPAVLEQVKTAVFQREEATSTYLDNGLAVPHGRIAELDQIVVCVGVHPLGVNWPNGSKKAKLVVLLGVPFSMITGYLVMMQKLLKWHRKTTLIHPDGTIDRLEDLKKELEEALA